MLVCGQCHSPASLPPERDPVPIAQEDGSGLVRNFWPPDPRTLQPAASHCTDCGIPTRDSAEEFVAVRYLSIASVRKQDDVSESVFVSVIRRKCREALTVLVRQTELFLTAGRPIRICCQYSYMRTDYKVWTS